MDFDPQPFNLLWALLHWVIVLGLVSAAALVVALLIATAAMGTDGPRFIFGQIGQALKGFVGLFTAGGLRRTSTIAGLTLKEAIRRKALWIFAIFAMLFMFAGWFLSTSTTATSDAAEPYITFVLTVITWLSLPLAILLSCWGLPEDIRVRSLHTVVTKPVRRVEIVMGRIVGYGLVTALMIAAMGAVGYVWVARTVPDRAQSQLIGRVPLHGELEILGRDGKPGGGINVGDIWEYRRYVDGNSLARGVYTFDDMPLDDLRDDGELRLEYDFEVFRSTKGDIVTGVQAQFTLINDRGTEDESDDLKVRFPELPFEVLEYTDSAEDAVQVVPRMLDGREGQPIDLFKQSAKAPPIDPDDPAASEPDGLINPDGQLVVSVRCIDPEQYLGIARRDLFVRLPDNPFIWSYTKAVIGILLQSLVLVIVGTTASCIVKGPVATFLTLGAFAMGIGASRDFADEALFTANTTNAANGVKVLGGGPLESVYRLVAQLNQTTQIPPSPAVTAMKKIDTALLNIEEVVLEVVPDLRPFNTSAYLKRGFDIPWDTSVLPALATTLGFLIPCVILGALCLQMRELEAK